jgi:flavin-dependent dehydrogenase
MATALLLAQHGHDVSLIERQQAGGPRRLTPQLQHAHALLPLFRSLLVARFPEVYADALSHGGRDIALSDYLDEPKRSSLVAAGEEDLVYFACRRKVIDASFRRVLARQSRVRCLTGAVTGYVLDGQRVTGVRTGAETIPIDLVVDATGRPRPRSTPAIIDEPCGIAYASRFYERRGDFLPGPLEHGFGAGGAYDGWSCQLFLQDDPVFVVVIGRSVDDRHLASIRHASDFEAALTTIPSIAEWTARQHSQPIGEVNVMAGMRNLLVDTSDDPVGLVRVGDSLATTDPAFGRGTAIALWEAVALADASTASPLLDWPLAYRSSVAPRLEAWVRDAATQSRRRMRNWRASTVRQPSQASEPLSPIAPRHTSYSLLLAAAEEDRAIWTVLERCRGLLDPPDALCRADVHRRLAALVEGGWRPRRATGPPAYQARERLIHCRASRRAVTG